MHIENDTEPRVEGTGSGVSVFDGSGFIEISVSVWNRCQPVRR